MRAPSRCQTQTRSSGAACRRCAAATPASRRGLSPLLSSRAAESSKGAGVVNSMRPPYQSCAQRRCDVRVCVLAWSCWRGAHLRRLDVSNAGRWTLHAWQSLRKLGEMLARSAEGAKQRSRQRGKGKLKIYNGSSPPNLALAVPPLFYLATRISDFCCLSCLSC